MQHSDHREMANHTSLSAKVSDPLRRNKRHRLCGVWFHCTGYLLANVIALHWHIVYCKPLNEEMKKYMFYGHAIWSPESFNALLKLIAWKFKRLFYIIMKYKYFHHFKSILLCTDLFHKLQYSVVYSWVINKPPCVARKQINESKPLRHVESLTHYCWRREPSVSVASMSLRLVEVIPLQLASLWYEDQLRREQWKTRPLRVKATLTCKSHLIPIKQYNSQLLLTATTITTTMAKIYFFKDIINLHKPPKVREKTYDSVGVLPSNYSRKQHLLVIADMSTTGNNLSF